MDNIKTNFTIADLENLSGISSDTIRKWESRYELLRPGRTRSNIRRYDVQNLKKLLAISFLYRNGYKISELASLSEKQLNSGVNDLMNRSEDYGHHINSFMIAMLSFDRYVFEETYGRLLSVMTFSDVFIKVIFPFLQDIGTLWQSNSITPAHEHFVSNLIRQKLLINIERLSYREVSGKETFVLFLPLNEIHELGLLFLHFTLLLHARNSIYLGAGIETKDLTDVRKNYPGPLTYITNMTVNPPGQKLSSYLADFRKTILAPNDQLWITGKKAGNAGRMKSPQVILFKDGRELAEHLTK